MSHAVRIVCCIWAVGLAACGGGRPEPATGPTAGAGSEAALSANRSGELRPGDALQVTVFQEPDLTGEFQVDQNGVAVFPLLGERQVTGISADSLERALVGEYREYLETPSINVTVLRRISILGEVRSPGLYPVDLTMSVNEALALAGGVAPSGNVNDVRIERDGEVLYRDMSAGIPLAGTPLLSGDRLVVGQRGWLSRNTALVTTLLGVAASLTIAIVVR